MGLNQRREEGHTPGPDFTKHLFALKDAIDPVQPLADYRGNLAALHALMVLQKAMADVADDISTLLGEG